MKKPKDDTAPKKVVKRKEVSAPKKGKKRKEPSASNASSASNDAPPGKPLEKKRDLIPGKIPDTKDDPLPTLPTTIPDQKRDRRRSRSRSRKRQDGGRDGNAGTGSGKDAVHSSGDGRSGVNVSGASAGTGRANGWQRRQNPASGRFADGGGRWAKGGDAAGWGVKRKERALPSWGGPRGARNPDLDAERASLAGRPRWYSEHDDRQGPGAGSAPRRRGPSPEGGGMWKHDLFDLSAKAGGHSPPSRGERERRRRN